MPKVTWRNEPKVEINYLAAVLREYKRASGLTSEQLAEKLGCCDVNVRQQIGKPADQWKIGTLKKYCEAIGCPISVALEAAAK